MPKPYLHAHKQPTMRTIILWAALCLAALSTAAQPVAPAKPAAAQWLGHTDSATGISVKYPATWRLKTTNPKSPIVLHAPADGEGDGFSENINYIVRDLPPGQKVTLADIAVSVRNGLTNMVDDFKLEYEKNLSWLGTKAIEFSHTGTSKGANAGLKVKLLQRIALVKNKMYLATYSAEDGKADPSRAAAIQIINGTKLTK
jgi:hypothetical protein